MASPDVGIYGIENTITDKWYIGSSVELSKRFSRHLWELRSGRHHSDKLQRSFDKHGVKAFDFKLLMVCSKEDLEFYESRAIKAYRGFTDGYNVAAEAKGGFMRGRNWPEATKAARIEEMKTRRMTEEQKTKISELKKAEWSNPEIHEARSASMRKPKSKEGAANIAAASLKRLRDPDPAQVEARRQNLLKGWETRRNNKRQGSL
jgi:group I intron endonuclease